MLRGTRRTRGPRRLALVAGVAALVAAACSQAGAEQATPAAVPLDRAQLEATDEAAATSPTTAPTTTTSEPAPTTAAPTTTTTEPPPPERAVAEQPWTPFATVGGITLHHPSSRVERVAFHESGHDGARQLDALPDAVAVMTLDSRDRGTGSRTAADIVVDPEVEVRAPVSGVVVRAGTYVLYCEHSDDYAVIASDSNPAWEVKVLHIDGVQVRAGDRVVAGETVLAPRPTLLPFESQVDEFRTADPAWPHVHIEVVDPSIPNTPKGGGC